jgi:hypothetical protein
MKLHRFAWTAAAVALAACTATGIARAPQSTAPAAEARAGLGTVWGEARRSPIREVLFERGAERPFSVASIHYNDLDGVKAMAARAGARALEGSVPLADGLVASVLDEWSQPLPAVNVGGQLYVVGVHGARYMLQVQNHSARRCEVVASVDGLDVVDGQPASFDKRGYVIDPGRSVTIDGFRRSDEEVAAFRFGAVADSYAARTGSDRDVGVIGMAFFDERRAVDAADLDERHSAAPFAETRYAAPPAYW